MATTASPATQPPSGASPAGTIPGGHPTGAFKTVRKDKWWLLPLLTVSGLGAFVVYSTIRAFIESEFPLARRRPLEDRDSLLDDGIIDSLGILEVVDFLEEKFEIQLSDDDLVSDNFESVATLTDLVTARCSGRGKAWTS